jgi:ribosomal protein S18 acetylase RimI-like enzyme
MSSTPKPHNQSIGVKTRHKALLYGMYVKAPHRESGVADEIMKRLIDEARENVEIVTLTVVSSNLRALRFLRAMGISRLWRRRTRSEEWRRRLSRRNADVPAGYPQIVVRAKELRTTS